MGPNIWPKSSLIDSAKFKATCEQYYSALEDLSLKILHLVGATLTSNGEIPTVFDDIAKSSPTPACPLRLLHYPSATRFGSTINKPQYGASAHTDFGAITLLLQDDNPGLEVLDTNENRWIPIDPNPDAYVVNIADIVSIVTRNLYKSSVHRVVCKNPKRERYSIVFFFDGCLDAVLRPIEGISPVDDENDKGRSPITVEQHMIERLTMSYGKGKKDPRREGE